MAATVAGIHLGIDTHANRPAANTAPDGSLYSCSTHSLVYKSNYVGNSWATWAALTGTGIPATLLDAKGDLIAASAADTADRLAVGTNGFGLVAASAEATGLKWQAALGFHGVHAKKTATFPTLTNATLTTLAFDAADTFDTDAFHDIVTNNSRLTVPTGLGGYYVPWVKVGFAGNATGRRATAVMKNAGLLQMVAQQTLVASGTSTQMLTVFMPLLLVATDYIEFQAVQNSGGNLATDEQECGMYLVGV